MVPGEQVCTALAVVESNRAQTYQIGTCQRKQPVVIAESLDHIETGTESIAFAINENSNFFEHPCALAQ